MPLDGSGKPEVVPGTTNPQGYFNQALELGLSPDGRSLAFLLTSGDGSEVRVAIADLVSGGHLRLLKPDSRISGDPQFTGDGKSLAYSITENGVDNIFIQPLDGSPGRNITGFNADHIADFHRSPDGKTLGVLRTHSDSDVVLLQETKP